MIHDTTLKDVERVVRITMVLILLVAATSKLFSHGGFFNYYSTLFQGSLRIRLPPELVNSYLTIIPYIELFLGLALLSNSYKRYTIYAWFAFILSLVVGHYVLQEWSAVNDMLDYIFLGLLAMVLPNHRTWFRRDPI